MTTESARWAVAWGTGLGNLHGSDDSLEPLLGLNRDMKTFVNVIGLVGQQVFMEPRIGEPLLELDYKEGGIPILFGGSWENACS